MLIYRVEHPLTHEGPYKHLSTRDEHTCITRKMVNEHNEDATNHPNPPNDGIADYDKYEFNCGFTNIEALHCWFDGYLNELHRVGFVLAKIRVPKNCLAYGRKQVIFRPNHVLGQTTYPLVEGVV